jgi:hypothetical protein
MTTMLRGYPNPVSAPTLPLVVDLDGTLLKVDTLYELFISGPL